MKHALHLAPRLAAGACILCSVAAGAQDARDDAREEAPPTRYVIGLSVSHVPEYSGAQRSVFKPDVPWAWERGRFRISSGGAGGLLHFASNEPDAGAGASADLASGQRWRLGAGLRIDNGRRSSDSDALAGVPDVRRTLRGRVYASYVFDRHWSTIASVSEDVLGRGGGASATLDLGYHAALSPRTAWSVGAGLRFGDARYMGARYGVTPDASLVNGRPAYDPPAGIESVGLGAGITTALTPHWLAFANAGVSSLRGGAAASPLTGARTGTHIGIGIAWRNGP